MKPPPWLSLLLLFLSVSHLLTACTSIAPRRAPDVPPASPPPDVSPTSLPPQAPQVPASFLAPLEQELADEINLARTQPHTYARFLGHQQQRPAAAPGGSLSVMTQEGRQALDEALTFLRSAAPLPPLAVSRGMSLGARDHVREQARTGSFGHRGSDGADVDERVKRYGRWQGQISENLSYGFDNGRLMTLALIIDEGVSDRGHRQNIFDAQARVLGVACGPHPAIRIVCVMTFADDYTENTP